MEDAEPFEDKSITSSQFHVTYADALTDLAEVILGTRSALRLSRDLCFPKKDPENKPYRGLLKSKDLEKYSRCLRALLNESIRRFDRNLIALDAHDRDDATKLNWVQVPKEIENLELQAASGKETSPTSPKKEQDTLFRLDWINFCETKNAPVYRKIIKKRWSEIDQDFCKHMLGKGLDFGKVSQWVGHRAVFPETAEQNTKKPPHMAGLTIANPGSEIERLLGYKFLARLLLGRINPSIPLTSTFFKLTRLTQRFGMRAS